MSGEPFESGIEVEVGVAQKVGQLAAVLIEYRWDGKTLQIPLSPAVARDFAEALTRAASKVESILNAEAN